MGLFESKLDTEINDENIDVNKNLDISCDSCFLENSIRDAKTICKHCNRYLCEECLETKDLCKESSSASSVYDDCIAISASDEATNVLPIVHDEHDQVPVNGITCTGNEVIEALPAVAPVYTVNHSIHSTLTICKPIQDVSNNARMGWTTPDASPVINCAQETEYKKTYEISKTGIKEYESAQTIRATKYVDKEIFPGPNVQKTKNTENNIKKTALVSNKPVATIPETTCIETKHGPFISTSDFVVPKLGAKINVKSPQDKFKCWISGIALLSRDSLVVIDGSNRKVKLVQINDQTIKSELTLSTQPFDVTVITRYEAAVTLPEQQRIQFFSVMKGLSKSRRMRVNGHCHGIDHRNDITAISFLCPDKVEIINNDGQILKVIEKDLRDKPLLDSPYYVALSISGKSVYISDYIKSRIIKHSVEKYKVTFYQDEFLYHPEGIAVLPDGTIIVASRDNNCLHQITENCEQKNIFHGRNSMLNKPWAICRCEETNQLYVSNDEGRYISIYDTFPNT